MQTSQISSLISALRHDLHSFVDDQGSIRQHCNSRGLESQLMLVLLRRMHTLPEVQRSLARFLSRYKQRQSLNELERRLVMPPGDDATCASPVEHFTAERKQWMFSTYFALIHGMPYLTKDQIVKLEYHHQASWVCLTLCAIKIINAYGANEPQLISDQDRHFLLDQLTHGSATPVWEGHLSAHLLSLLALQTFAPAHPLLMCGTRVILAWRNCDGGLPFITQMTIYLTAFAGVALSTSGKRSQKMRGMADYLAAEQAQDGAWPYSEHVTQTDIDSTCLALECLQRVDPVRHALSIQRGQDYLAGMANLDGGFPTYHRNHPSEATMTANVIIALAPMGRKYADLLRSALAFLAAVQHADGTFERSWSLSATFAIARVISAVHHAARFASPDLAENVRSKSMAYLLRAQNPDGGWGQVSGQRSDVISTAHALSALSYLDNTQALRRAVRYLQRRSGKHARFQALPDQAAPRPIPYQFPVLAQIFALNALGDAAKVICASSHPPAGANGRSLPHGRDTAACSQSPRECRVP